MKLKSFLAVVVVMAASLLQAQGVKQLAREVYQTSGMNLMVKNVDQQFASQLDMHPSLANNPETGPYKKAMLQVLNAKNLEKLFLTYLEEEVPLAELETMVKLYKNPMVQEFSLLEQGLLQPEKQKELVAFREQLVANPPSADRLKLVDRLIDDQKTAETAMDMTTTMVGAMIRGGNAMLPEAQRLDEEQISERMKKSFPPNFEVLMRQSIQANCLFAYKDVDDEKLARYVSLWQSDEGRTTAQHVMEALATAFAQIGEQLGKSLASVQK